ncbi:MAG TPA: tetratricopeptide repeat protein [Candidatus Deferrimicrobium sp.]|nr:tetratricopeptide repeat protein [Candidatus Deferrimicrobium sp.]
MLNREKALELGLTLLIVLSLGAASLYGYFYTKTSTDQTAGAQNDPLRVIADLQKKTEANPNDTTLQENLGNSCFDYGDSLRNDGNTEEAKEYFDRAIKAYKKVQEISPKVSVQVDMATALYYSEKTDEAEAAYQKAIELDPNYLNARLNYGIFLANVKSDPSAARVQLTKALELKPQGLALQRISEILKNLATSQGQSTGVLDYTKDVEPVIFQNCTSCHGPGGVMAKAPLHTWEYVKKYVTPKDANSPLLRELKSPIHPVQQKSEVISLIEDWVMSGAQGPK